MSERGDRVNASSGLLADEDALRLLEQLHRAVMRVCPHWQAVEREDLVQNAIVKVIELRRRNPERADLSFSYLARVVYSAFIDEVRRRRRRGEEELDGDDEPKVESANPGPERRSIANELGRAILGCLATLIQPRRLAVTLYLQGHTVSEIAGLMGWKPKRAENLASRGRDDLRKCLEGKGVTR